MCQAPPFFMTLFILGCAGSSLLLRLFSSCREQGVLPSCDRGYLIARASLLEDDNVTNANKGKCHRITGTTRLGVGSVVLVAPRHVGSFLTRNQTCVSCIDRQILYHCRLLFFFIDPGSPPWQSIIDGANQSLLFTKKDSYRSHELVLCTNSSTEGIPGEVRVRQQVKKTGEGVG